MEFIGSGWQFDVYADGDMVEKRLTSGWSIARRLVQNYPQLLVRPATLAARVRGIVRRRGEVLRHLERIETPDALIAGFRNDRGRLVQRRATPLGQVIRDADDPYRVLDAYIDSIVEGWRHGIAESSFNFTVNHGVDAEGRVVILDVGELVFDRRVVAGMIAHCFWEGGWSTRSLPSSLRRYFLSAMAERITGARLQAEWRDARPIRPRADDRDPRPLDRAARRHRRASRTR